jgi:ATP-dependent helicase/nuclease subunit A
VSDYLADGLPIDEADFTSRACDPSRSAVVEACAGSGKTWLLVSRILRLLLAGAAPGEILAITFTRRAAHEMQARLLRDLKHLAEAGDDDVCASLQARGLTADEARRATGAARDLYEHVVTARAPLTIETFHGWFWQLVTRAPLGCGVPFAPVLLEAAERIRADAWLHFTVSLLRPEHAVARDAWGMLIDEIGDFAAKELLMQFLHKRAEWWSFEAAGPTDAMERVLRSFGTVGDDPALSVRDPSFVDAIGVLSQSWRSIRPALRTTDGAIARAEAWLSSAPSRAGTDLRRACLLVLTKSGLTPIQALAPERLATRLGSEAEIARYAGAYDLVIGRLQQVLAARRVWRARRLNQAAVQCGRLLLAIYQDLKARQHELDFTDLEWHALRLLSDDDNAAYMQARLDSRYRHVLLDEFQDTNALQWQVLQSWLAAYGPPGEADEYDGGVDRPTVFVVGDPKQSIYRFRRAEPRVFDAAIELLGRDFAACHLRTNVTRRNPQAVIDVLNRCMSPGNPLFQRQSTRVDPTPASGAFVMLPLAESLEAANSAGGEQLRDVLTTPRVERDSDTRYREGRALANEIAAWRGRLQVSDDNGPRSARWSDVTLLVRRRTHLGEYERALRDAGIPFISDRGAGLLETLEADDLTALLQFLTAPDSDLRLAHALRSPLFGCSDADLIRLASAADPSWWQRLLNLEAPSAELARARQLLQRWLELARVLPVHDLLDRVYFEGDARRRYAAIAPAALHAQVQANLDAFIELALRIDAGRFPSLSRFIDELSALKRNARDDAPDEGSTGSEDAVRVLTIHGAKGLEAEIVVLADAHAGTPTDGAGVLVSWAPDSPCPEHFSLVVRGEDGRDDARESWFARDDEQRAQEDWNLLYVAATRARQVLIVSGSAPTRGNLEDTWYRRLEAALDRSTGAAPALGVTPPSRRRWVRDFLPEPQPTGRREPEDGPDTDALRLGRAWHALLEMGSPASAAAVSHQHALTVEQTAQVVQAALRVWTALPHLFGSDGLAEVELVSPEGERLRIDRLVERDGVLWIIDFKWRAGEAELPLYQAQVRRYGAALRAIREDVPVRLALVTAAAEFVEVPG